jgi:hypothetical protein
LAAGRCSADLACVNGVCSARCSNGAACPAGTYCEGDSGFDEVCAPIAPTVCAETAQCPPPQFCNPNVGMCTSNALLADGGRGACSLSTIPIDGCSPDALCYTGTGGGASCIGLSACNQDGGCPTGQVGATCNVRPDGGRLFAGKQRVCLVSFCDGPSDCPAGAPHCVNGFGTARSGCSPGTKGFPCVTGADCNTGTCTPNADAGLFGACT